MNNNHITSVSCKWNKKMNDVQTDDFFLSITEYDNSREEIVKSKIKNLGFYIDTYGQLTIAFEIHRTESSDSWVALDYAIYDERGKIRETGQAGCLHDGFNSKPFTHAIFEIKPSKIAKIKLFWS
jgi:hypothetical protein